MADIKPEYITVAWLDSKKCCDVEGFVKQFGQEGGEYLSESGSFHSKLSLPTQGVHIRDVVKWLRANGTKKQREWMCLNWHDFGLVCHVPEDHDNGWLEEIDKLYPPEKKTTSSIQCLKCSNKVGVENKGGWAEHTEDQGPPFSIQGYLCPEWQKPKLPWDETGWKAYRKQLGCFTCPLFRKVPGSPGDIGHCLEGKSHSQELTPGGHCKYWKSKEIKLNERSCWSLVLSDKGWVELRDVDCGDMCGTFATPEELIAALKELTAGYKGKGVPDTVAEHTGQGFPVEVEV